MVSLYTPNSQGPRFSLVPHLATSRSLMPHRYLMTRQVDRVVPAHLDAHRIHGKKVYLPTWMVDFYGFHVGKYTSPMDAMGNGNIEKQTT